MQGFFFRRSSLDCSAFLSETVETGDKNRDDLRCTQMSLVISMRLFSVMTEMMHVR